jgi:hypothetical protein
MFFNEIYLLYQNSPVQPLSYPSHVLVLFGDVMDGLGSSFSPHFSTCILTASNKSSNNTVMKESVLYIVLLNDFSLEFAKSFLTAS